MRLRLAATACGLLLIMTGCAGRTQAYPSPDGGFSVEVTRTSEPPDTLWVVTVQVGVTATVRSWTVGCLSDDGTDGTPTDVVWTGPRTFRVGTTTGADVLVRIDDSGRPAEVRQPARALRTCP